MPVTPAALHAFAGEVRRLISETEQSLYPAYQRLLEAAFPNPPYRVDMLRAAPTTGFPDLTISRGNRLANWIEIKKPDVSVPALPPEDERRFRRYRESLPHIVLTNGHTWVLYVDGEQRGEPVSVPSEWLSGRRPLSPGEERTLVDFLNRLPSLAPAAATTEDDAVRLLADAAAVVFDALMQMMAVGLPTPIRTARDSFSDLLRTNPADPQTLDDDDFADALAQTCVFGYVVARIERGSDIDVLTAHGSLDPVEHPFLSASLHALVSPDPELQVQLRPVLETVVDAVNASAPALEGSTRNWHRLPYVYEPFFARYRPEDRFKFGVFYTPEQVTRFQIREIQRVLRQKFGLTGLNDPSVRYLDPACGTGTYLLALAEEALAEAQEGGDPPQATLHDLFLNRVVGFEVSPGPASVAQARLTAWLRAHGIRLHQRFPVYILNTLTPPHGASISVSSANLWARNLSREAQSGDAIKAATPVLVVVGNPPWGTRDRQTFQVGPLPSDNWIHDWAAGSAGAVIQLYDLYIAFWRFAVRMLLERASVQPARGIVSYITNRTWLRGKAQQRMREWLRGRGVEASVTDLGGDARARRLSNDEGIFAIMAGCAISTLAFDPSSIVPTVEYRRVLGNREDKLRALAGQAPLPPAMPVTGTSTDPFAPVDWGALAESPRINEFFVQHFPGVKTHRDELLIDIDRDALLARIEAWNELPEPQRTTEFGPSSTHRAAPAPYSVVPGYTVAHRYRPLDTRWLYFDRRLIDRPGSISRLYERAPETVCLLSMDSRTGTGPVVIATNALPGYNSFRGSYETHAFPVTPPVDQDLALGNHRVLSARAEEWARRLSATEGDVAAYILALGNAPTYAEIFAEALETEIIRLPATVVPALFADAVAIGRRLLRAWCLQLPAMGSWRQRQAGEALGAVSQSGTALLFENGDLLEDVHPETLSFEVSGYPVMSRFIEARAHCPISPSLATEIRRVAASISEILDAREHCDDLLRSALEARKASFS